MKKEYVVSTKSGEMYRSFYKIPMPFYCFGNSDITVTYAKKYSDAKKFRSLRLSTYRARYLSNHGRDYYYVFTAAARKDGLYLMDVVDDTINDKLKESRKECQEKIMNMISEWKAEKGLK